MRLYAISQSPRKSVDEGSTISFVKGKKSDSSDVKTTTELVHVPYTVKMISYKRVVHIKIRDMHVY